MGIVELSDAGRIVVDALIAGPTAWQTPAAVAGALGRGLDETMDLLCDLDVAGWVEVWEGEAGPLVTLSPLGAERLGVRLVESGAAETPRWANVGDPEPPPSRSRNVCAGARGASLEFVADPLLPPHLAAERAERAARVAALLIAAKAERRAGSSTPMRYEDLPFPSMLLGVGLTPWPGPGQAIAADGICPACGGKALRPHMYCLCCDHWGFDRPTPTTATATDPVATPPRPGRPRSTPGPVAERLQIERFRAGRKAKRQRRQQARNAAGRQGGVPPTPGR